jgi:hypothetical protein
MGASADLVKVTTFERRVRFLAQQGIARLRPWVMENTEGGEAHNFERLGVAEAVLKTTRKTATPDDDTPWSRRKSIPVIYHRGDVYEKADINQMLVDPNSSYVKAQGMAMKRAIDKEIIAAAVGASRDGAGASVTFPAGQIIGAGATPITFDLVTQVQEKFANNNVDPEEPKVFVITPAQQRRLLQLTEATSKDYTMMDALRKGYVDSWMGFTWIVHTGLPTSGTNIKDNFAMTRSAIGLQMNQDVSTEVAKDPSISFAWRVYSYLEAGAIRVEDEQLVKIPLNEVL